MADDQKTTVTVEVDPAVPPGEIRLQVGGETIAKIVNVAPEPPALLSPAPAQEPLPELDKSDTTRIPAEVFHPSEFILEEMEARGWDRDELARRMGPDVAVNRLSLDLYCEVGPTEPNLRIGDGEDLARAFGVSAEFWTNLETAWLKGVQNV